MVYTLRFFLFKMRFVSFGSCIIHILYIECAKIKKNNSGTKRLRHPVHRADNLTTIMCCVEILEDSTSWSPKGLSRPVMGELYLYTKWELILQNGKLMTGWTE